MDWILSCLTIVGNSLIGRKIKWGWIVMGVCTLMWIYYAVFILNPPQYGLVPASVVTFIISVVSAIKWFREDMVE
jgi:hypothetical protein